MIDKQAILKNEKAETSFKWKIAQKNIACIISQLADANIKLYSPDEHRAAEGMSTFRLAMVNGAEALGCKLVPKKKTDP